MKRIIALSFSDHNAFDGLDKLFELYPEAIVVTPVDGNLEFLRSIVAACDKHGIKTHLFVPDTGADYEGANGHTVTTCANPLKEILRNVTPDDVLAIVWDDSIDAHMVLHSVEDYGLEVWDITEGLDPIEMDQRDSDDLYTEMQDAMTQFIDVFAAYVVEEVLNKVTKTVESLLLNAHEDIDPFEE